MTSQGSQVPRRLIGEQGMSPTALCSEPPAQSWSGLGESGREGEMGHGGREAERGRERDKDRGREGERERGIELRSGEKL